MPGTPKIDRPRRVPSGTDADYKSECLDCGWADDSATDTKSARYHALRHDHTTTCAVAREFTYSGTRA